MDWEVCTLSFWTISVVFKGTRLQVAAGLAVLHMNLIWVTQKKPRIAALSPADHDGKMKNLWLLNQLGNDVIIW